MSRLKTHMSRQESTKLSMHGPSLRSLTDSPWPAMALTAVLCCIGIWWGYTEIWNADQMAFKDHFRKGALPFSPLNFDKPPLYSYLNFVFSVAPREIAVRTLELVTGNEYGERLDYLSVWLAKLLQALFACGSVYLLWRIVARFSGPAGTALPALLLATSAGFIVQAHLISTDLPVVFFMLLAFWACQRILEKQTMRAYILAGLCIGLAGAMKYNGLVVGLALPVFHYFGQGRGGMLRATFDPRYIAGLASVPAGFLLGNPYAAIEFNRFAADLNYLFTTSPQYVGASGEARYDANLLQTLATDHIGWPLFGVLAATVPVALYLAVRDGRSGRAATFWAAAAIALFYAAYFATRTNLQVRWVIVIVPMALIAAAPAWEWLREKQLLAGRVLATALVSYGIVCSVQVGLRFSADPRFEALEWAAAEIPDGATIESSTYVPKWNNHAKVKGVYEKMPSISGRRRVFEDVFADDPAILSDIRARDVDEMEWYTVPALLERSPDFIAISSLYFDRFMEGRLVAYYPELHEYFSTLLAGDAGYEVAFDKFCCDGKHLLYPQEILFLDNRIIILGKTNGKIR